MILVNVNYFKDVFTSFYSLVNNLTSVQKYSEFDLRDVLWRDILTILSFKFVFSLEVEKNCWYFICPKLFDAWG